MKLFLNLVLVVFTLIQNSSIAVEMNISSNGSNKAAKSVRKETKAQDDKTHYYEIWFSSEDINKKFSKFLSGNSEIRKVGSKAKKSLEDSSKYEMSPAAPGGTTGYDFSETVATSMSQDELLSAFAEFLGEDVEGKISGVESRRGRKTIENPRGKGSAAITEYKAVGTEKSVAEKSEKASKKSTGDSSEKKSEEKSEYKDEKKFSKRLENGELDSRYSPQWKGAATKDLKVYPSGRREWREGNQLMKQSPGGKVYEIAP